MSGWGARGEVTIGAGSRIDNGAIIQIGNGGRITIGDNVWIRAGAVLNVNSGHLEIGDDVVISWYAVIHCGERVVIDDMVGVAEGVTVVDGSHFHGPEGAPDEHFYTNGTTAPIIVGRNTWLASKCTVTAGVTLGPRTTVAAHAMVRAGTYPKNAMLVGIPARVLDVQPAQQLDGGAASEPASPELRHRTA